MFSWTRVIYHAQHHHDFPPHRDKPRENRKIYILIPNRNNSEDGKNEARIASEYWKWKPQMSTRSSFSQCHRLILSNQSREGFSLQWTIYLNIQMNDKCNKICFSDGTGLRLDRTGVTCLEFWRKPTHYPRPPLPLGVRSLFPYLPSYLRKSLGDCTRKKRQSLTIYVGKNQPKKGLIAKRSLKVPNCIMQEKHHKLLAKIKLKQLEKTPWKNR